MRWSPRLLACACAALVASAASSALAQQEWDPAQYEALSQEGQRLFDEAITVPETRIAMRRSLMFQANDRMKSALSMIRFAFETGAVDDSRTAALGDFFTLMENLIVVWIHIDACWPAERLWTFAMDHPDLPSQMRDLFEPLPPALEACRDRAPLWDWFQYQVLVDDAEMAMMLAPTAPDPTQKLIEATRNSREALTALRPAVFGGALLESPVDSPAEELIERYRVTIELLTELGECEAANERFTEAQLDAAILTQVDVAEVEPWQPLIESCEPHVVEVAEEDVDDGPILSPREGVSYALIGASAAMLAGVLIIELTSREDLDELEELQEQCAVGPCDYERAMQLSEDIDRKKLASGLLVGGAIVAGTVAIVLLLTGRDDESQPEQTRLVPLVGPDGFGAAFQLTY